MNVENNKSDVVIVKEVNKDSQAHRIERAMDRAAFIILAANTPPTIAFCLLLCLPPNLLLSFNIIFIFIKKGEYFQIQGHSTTEIR